MSNVRFVQVSGKPHIYKRVGAWWVAGNETIPWYSELRSKAYTFVSRLMELGL